VQASGVQVDASGWVSGAAGNLGAIVLGSPAGNSIAGAVQGLWVLPDAVAFNSLASAGSTLPDLLAAITSPSAAAPTVALQVLTAAPVVGASVRVSVSASTPAGSSIRVKLTFWGAAPRCAMRQTQSTQCWHSSCHSALPMHSA